MNNEDSVLSIELHRRQAGAGEHMVMHDVGMSLGQGFEKKSRRQPDHHGVTMMQTFSANSLPATSNLPRDRTRTAILIKPIPETIEGNM